MIDPSLTNGAPLRYAAPARSDLSGLSGKAGSLVSDDVKAWDQKITDFFPHRHSLTVGPVVMLYDRPVIPRSLQQAVMEHLHVGHASASSMFERASGVANRTIVSF